MESKLFFEFGPFRLDEKKCILWANGVVVHIEPKAARTLLALVRAKGKPVDKNALIAEVWEGVAVTDSSLTRNISILRSIINEFLPGQECIKTIPKVGYSFALQVSEFSEEPPGLALLSKDVVHESSNGSNHVGAVSGDAMAAAPEIGLLNLSNSSGAETRHQTAGTHKFNVRRAAAVTITLLLLAAAIVYVVGRWTREVPAANPVLVKPPAKRLAVYGFKNLSRRPDKNWLSTAFSEMLSTELGVDKSVNVLAPEQVAQARSDLALVSDDDLTLESLQKFRKVLNVDLVVLGLYTVSGAEHADKIRLDIRVQNAVTGETVAWMKTVGWEDDLPTLVDDVGKTLRSDLGLRAASTEDAESAGVLFPANRKAAQLYSEGLAKLRLFDDFAARRLLEKAVMIEPGHPLIHAALARALADLGYERAARREGAKAVALAQDLPMEERLSIEGQYRETTKEWDKAIAAYRSLFDYAPGKLEYGLRLAQAQADGGYGKEALATIEGLRRNGGDAQDPRLDLAEARALGDFKAILLAAGNAVTHGSARGERLLVADSLLLQAFSSYKLGSIDKAVSATEQAEDLYRLLGNEAGIAKALVARANALRDTGKVAQRKRMYEDAIAIFKRIGNMSSRARALNALAGVYQDLGDPAQAMRKYREALDIFQAVGDKGNFANSLNNIGTVFEGYGDLVSAKRTYERALSLFRQMSGSAAGVAMCTDNVADILQKEGRLEEARIKFEEALTIYQNLELKIGIAALLAEIGEMDFAEGHLAAADRRFKNAFFTVSQTDNKLIRAETLRSLARVSAAQGNFDEAEGRYREAVGLVDQVGSHFLDARLDLARLYITKDRYSDAEREARIVLQEYEKQRSTDNISAAKEVLARALLGVRNLRAARQAIESARKIAKRSQDPRLHLAITITRARIVAAADPSALIVSRRELTAAMAESKMRGYQILAFEAQLAIAEVEILSGERDSARRMCEKLSTEALAMGFVSIAGKAQALMEPEDGQQ